MRRCPHAALLAAVISSLVPTALYATVVTFEDYPEGYLSYTGFFDSSSGIEFSPNADGLSYVSEYADDTPGRPAGHYLTSGGTVPGPGGALGPMSFTATFPTPASHVALDVRYVNQPGDFFTFLGLDAHNNVVASVTTTLSGTFVDWTTVSLDTPAPTIRTLQVLHSATLINDIGIDNLTFSTATLPTHGERYQSYTELFVAAHGNLAVEDFEDLRAPGGPLGNHLDVTGSSGPGGVDIGPGLVRAPLAFSSTNTLYWNMPGQVPGAPALERTLSILGQDIPDNITIDFAGDGVTAFGLNAYTFSPGTLLDFTVFAADDVTVLDTFTGVDMLAEYYFGYGSTQNIGSVRIAVDPTTPYDAFSIDNVAFSPVPEPVSPSIIAVGLLALRRRRRAN